jgi:hypothetical protein
MSETYQAPHAPEYEKVDLSTEEYTAKLAEAPVFAKKAEVSAVVAAAGQEVRTVLANGTEETVNYTEEGDVIVTNPGGEQYILKSDNFTKRYEATAQEGIYRAKGMARAFKNDTGAPIEIMAPWGEPQFGDENCLIATVFDPENPDEIGSDRYIIGGDEFAATYGPIEEVLADDTIDVTEDSLATESLTENQEQVHDRETKTLLGGLALGAEMVMTEDQPAEGKEDVNPNELSKQIDHAIQFGTPDDLEALFDNGMDINQEDFEGRTALMMYSAMGKVAAVEMLLARGADINRVYMYHGRKPNTALDAANQTGNKAIADMLISLGAKTGKELSSNE